MTDRTQAIADLLQKQAELGTQLSEKLKARAQEFTADAANRVTAANRAAGAKKAA